MRVGLDFDNTIVCYDHLFHRVALDAGLIPAGLPANKVLVRDHLRRNGREDDWTAMQGEVYGNRMAEADAYPGMIETVAWAADAGCTLFIISHKTHHPFSGPAYDLHSAARAWLDAALAVKGAPLVPADRVFFEPTKADKLRRISACACDLYIDDLPEILTAPDFPTAIGRLLFDPEGHHADTALPAVRSWSAVRDHIAARLGARTASRTIGVGPVG